MKYWSTYRNADHSLEYYWRLDHGIRLVVMPDGVWSAHQLEGRRLHVGEADGASLAIEAADLWVAARREAVR